MAALHPPRNPTGNPSGEPSVPNYIDYRHDPINFGEKFLTRDSPTATLPARAVGMITFIAQLVPDPRQIGSLLPCYASLHIIRGAEYNGEFRTEGGKKIKTPFVIIDGSDPQNRFKGLRDGETVTISATTERLNLSRFGSVPEAVSITLLNGTLIISRNNSAYGDIKVSDRRATEDFLNGAALRIEATNRDIASHHQSSFDGRHPDDNAIAERNARIAKNLRKLEGIHLVAARESYPAE